MTWEGEERWKDVHTFRYTGLAFDRHTGVATFDFAHQGRGTRHGFTETVHFPLPDRDVADDDALWRFERVLELLYIAVGTAYYKAVAPRRVAVDSIALSPAAVAWAEQLYRDGLAEFAYNWDLEHVVDLSIAVAARPPTSAADNQSPTGRPVVAMSGGKDSLVTFEVLRDAGFDPAVFKVEQLPRPRLADILPPGRQPQLVVRPRQDPNLAELAKKKLVRSGHPPLTAMNSLVGAAVSALHGYGPVVMANERSADEANLQWRGRDVNHQWSKSGPAESALIEALREHAGVVSGCFSLLRGLSELQICRLFAAASKYDSVVTSCNVVHRASYRGVGQRWCLDCAKCRWTFLAFAVSMGQSRLLDVFGRNLLADPGQIDGYRELLGLTGHKPFECVGEILEARVAVRALVDKPEWRDSAVVRALSTEVGPQSTETIATVWHQRTTPWLPAEYQAALSQFIATCSRVSHGGS